MNGPGALNFDALLARNVQLHIAKHFVEEPAKTSRNSRRISKLQTLHRFRRNDQRNFTRNACVPTLDVWT